MEPLESRIARLTPAQQDEVGDFVDFLLLKNNIRQGQESSQSSLIMVNTPPVMVPDHPFIQMGASVPCPGRSDTGECPPPAPFLEPSPSVIHEIAKGSDDMITRDYMDYGKYDEQPSPATEAVKKVRHKIIAREEKEKSRHILEWVD